MFPVEFRIFIFSRIGKLISELQSQLVSQLWSAVSAQHHILHLSRLNHQTVPVLNLLEGLGNVLLVDPSAAVLDQDGPEAELQGVEGRGGDTDIGGDTTDINICAAVLSYQLLQAGLTQLSIVKKCRVRVNIGIDSLVDDVFLWVFLPQILTRLKTSDISPP